MAARVDLVKEVALVELTAEHEHLRVRVHLKHHAIDHGQEKELMDLFQSSLCVGTVSAWISKVGHF